MIQLRRILLPTDFSPHSLRAAQYAFALAEKFDAKVHVLHVLDTIASATPSFVMGLAVPLRGHESEQAARRAIEEFVKQAGIAPSDTVNATADGAPFVEIIRYAKANEIDLIVMGTHGRSALQHALMGNVAERVVRKAPCPVMTIRPEGHQFVMP